MTNREGETALRAVVQRTTRAQVRVDGGVVGAIDGGLVVFVGIGRRDAEEDAAYLAEKIAALRIFADAEERLNRSLRDTGGAALVVPNFTLYGDTSSGRRPSFQAAAPYSQGERLYGVFVAALKERIERVATGVFGAMMDVELVNDGPVTLLLDTEGDL